MSRAVDCEAVEQDLAARLGPGKDPGRIPLDVEVAAHLTGCDRCRAFDRRLHAVVDELCHHPVLDPGPAYWRRFPRRVRSTLAGEGPAGRGSGPWSRWPVWSGLAAAAALLALILIQLPAPGDAAPGGDSARGTTRLAADAALTMPDDADGALATSLQRVANGPDVPPGALVDELLGARNAFETGWSDVTAAVDDLDRDQQLELLDALRAEVNGPA
ncbi:MAG: hypothetical protein ACE5IK_04090 [Acidobacteriota bacterium]